ncbi:serine/threonine transporter SstT [Candidatus Enterococcus ferrettii]|uniref:serine/threonine transporter SstT n=1 Tax=Candidatus Enterococcus ferrettii TaxID=2815324 RepID=UPI001A9ACD37|nr:serine/threonine transporter SstT [Enterococcus sp. 665A]MBO1342742.1 serine/threonine transporter SstT [Enterococcus sp. 665A]
MLEFFKNLSLIKRIVIGIIIGAILGIVVPQWTFIAILGDLFVGALKAIAPILVFVLILASVAKHQTGTKTFIKPIIALYLFTTLLAGAIAVVASFIFPVKITLQEVSGMQEAPQALSEVMNTILTNIVQNPIQAMAEGNYLALLFWAALIGFALRTRNQRTKDLADDLATAITHVVQLIIALAPFGILGLVYQSVATTGVKGLAQYGQLLLLLVGTMLVVALIAYPLVAFILIRQNPYPLVFFCLKESAIPAFFTRSSAANIPINMMLAKHLGLSEESYSISLPLGATINMGGAAVTISIMTLATVHTLGMEVSLGLSLILCVLSALSACGASGIAGGSLLLIPLACSLFGIPNDIAMQVVGVGFIIGVVQDSVETAVNSSNDLFFTAVAELADLRKKGKDLKLKERLAN